MKNIFLYLGILVTIIWIAFFAVMKVDTVLVHGLALVAFILFVIHILICSARSWCDTITEEQYSRDED